ncbi:hypothetical protein [Helicobacter saguini]|uniref:hypothetical protein n=1 Tax=Helicobacter saguini TaxID=1548018 RepID=UPI001F458761|nr:hypothetical protein [Helicobacter saguini]
MTDFEVENDRALFNSLNKDKDFIISKEFDYICKTEKYTNNAGSIDDEIGYFVQDIWGARKVYKERMRRFFDSLESGPKDSIESSLRQSSQKLKSFIHYDVGSRVDGFIAHLLTFNQNVCLIDIRPMSSMESNFLTNGGGGGKLYPSRCYKP